MNTVTIGSALADRRLELGLDKGKAAKRIGMSRTTYSSYELDSQRPSVEVFPALAEFLDLSIEDLLVLYGATCVAAARSSFIRISRPSSSEDEAREDAEVPLDPRVSIDPSTGAPATSGAGLVAPALGGREPDGEPPTVSELESPLDPKESSAPVRAPTEQEPLLGVPAVVAASVPSAANSSSEASNVEVPEKNAKRKKKKKHKKG
jgi:transcriptional regulator with XRE-family HTH domain